MTAALSLFPITDHLNALASAWTGLVGAVVWQSTLLAGLVALAARLARRSSPALRYWLWQVVAIKLLLMPCWTVWVPWPFLSAGREPEPVAQVPGGDRPLPAGTNSPPVSGPEPAGAVPPVEGAPEPPLAWVSRVTWQGWLLVGWFTVVLWQLGRLLRQRVQLGRLLRAADPATGPRLQALVREAAERLGLRRVPSVVLVEACSSPFVCGVRHPWLVLPRSLLTTLQAAQLRQVLLHELAHLRRRDLLWGWVPEIARMLYFFHPVAHWVGYQIRLERELACDQLAMSLGGHDAAEYAETLLQVVSHTSQPPVLQAAAAASVGLAGDVAPNPASTPSEESVP